MSETAVFRSEGRSERESDWQVAHEQLVSLARSRAGLDFEEGRWLVAALRGGAHVRLGYGSFVEYVERLFGYGPRLTQDKLRVAEALEELPALAQALRQGQACWSALRELTRVATPETEGEWLAAAQGKTAREVERLVSGHLPGSWPADAPAAAAQRHVLRLEVSGEVLATFREAMGKGGDHDPNNLATLCSAHHRAIHRGHVYIEGTIATGLQFRHADGTAYGPSVAIVASSAVDVRAKAFRALRGLGFGEAEVRRALGQTAPHTDHDASVELIVRRCLLTLTGRNAAHVG